MSILIGADIVPTKSNVEQFNKGDAEFLVGDELLKILNDADYRIFNLEVPLTDVCSPIDKCGPNLIAPTSTINGYKSIGVDFVTLANNHILDQGVQGLQSTCDLLRKNNIAYCGVGDNISLAKAPYIFELDGKKIGIYACAEHEFSIATEDSDGANPFDPLESFDHVSFLKQEVDYVIVLYHGGKEHYRYPSPYLQRVCRKFVKSGADLVVCQHSHCIGCEEKYLDGTIVYGQGNFLFDDSESEFWQTSLLIKIDNEFKISYIPIRKNNETVRLATPKDACDILDFFIQRSEAIKQKGFIEARYSEFAYSMLNGYLSRISGCGKSLFFRILNKLTRHRYGIWKLKRRFGKQQLLSVQNALECEAHRELLNWGIIVKMKNFNNR
jgi:putative poly-gamma-glutamate synthesis protein